MSDEWTPANERQHPPFEPGNTMALQHGAYSPAVIEPLAGAFVDTLLADEAHAHLREPGYRPTLWSYARLTVQADRLHGALLAHQAEQDCVSCKRCIGLEERWERADAAALKRAQQLGLTPLARARLGRAITAAQVDMATLMERAQRRREEQG